MKAITVEPKQPGSARWEEVPEPDLQSMTCLRKARSSGSRLLSDVPGLEPIALAPFHLIL